MVYKNIFDLMLKYRHLIYLILTASPCDNENREVTATISQTKLDMKSKADYKLE